MSEQTSQNLKEQTETLLTRLCLKGEADVSRQEENTYKIDIRLNEQPRYGLNADVVLAVQHALRLLHESPEIRIVVDIDGFQAKEGEKLRAEVQDNIEKARQSGHIVYLRPMSPFERRQAHMMIEEAEGVESESVGEDPRRRIIIKPSA